MKSFAVALATLFASASALTEEAKNIRKHLGVDRVISIQHEHIDDNIRSLLVEHDADHFGTHDTAAHLKLSPEAIAALEKKGIHFEDTTEKWINHFEENYNDKNFFCTEGTEACSRRDMQAFYSSYQTLEAVHQRITDVAAANPTKAAIGSMGTSFQGRDLKYIRIGDLTKPIVFYQCNIHAREWLPPMYCTYMAETLLANGGHVLLNTLSFIIIPSVNPDGYVYSYTTSSTWRKTRKPNSGSSCVGTDGNRNWADHHCGQGASTSPCSETYCGITPFDQPETKAVSDFATTLKGRLFSFADIHSYGGYWMSPYGWTYALPPASVYNKMRQCFEAAAVAVRATNGLSFITGSSANAIYIAAGGSDDWFNSALDVIYSFSVELRGSSFQPAATNIMPSNLEIFNGMVASLNCAINLELSSSAPTNFPTPAPVTAAPVPPVSTPTNFPTPAPVQTPVPTPFPTPAPTCVDLNPNGITYSNGAPAPCPELVSYCTVYTFVAQRCPKTCGTCSLAVSQKSVSPAVIGGGVAPGVVYALVPVAAALIAGLAAALVIIRRQKAQVLQNATAAVSAETKEVVVEDKKENVSPAVLASTPSGKNAPKDMFDV